MLFRVAYISFLGLGREFKLETIHRTKKAWRLILFLRDAHTNHLFKSCYILRLHDKVAIENCIFKHNSFKKNNFLKLLIAGLYFLQTLIPITKDGCFKVVLRYFLIETNSMKQTSLTSMLSLPWITIKTFPKINCFTN